jgi:glycosyltransferase involved in cell wall biosynthesis
MRIVIDFQEILTKHSFSAFSNLKEIVDALIGEAPHHEWWLIINTAFPENALMVRTAYEKLIPKGRIKVLEKSCIETEPVGAWEKNLHAEIYQFFLKTLKPDGIIQLTPSFITAYGWSEVETVNISRESLTSLTAQSATKFLQAISQYHQEKDAFAAVSKVVTKKPRLAYISPLPPEKTGIATYSMMLLPHLMSYYEIDLIINQDKVLFSGPLATLPQYSAAWFKQNAHLYDRVIYQIGNSRFHGFMYELLTLCPGVIVLHDFFIGSGLAYEEMFGNQSHVWTNALCYSHGYRALLEREQVEGLNSVKISYPCNLPVLERAKKVIVHSNYSTHLAKFWYGPECAKDWAIVHLPKEAPVLIDKDSARAILGIDPDAFLVCSFGFISYTKCPRELLRAWLASSLASHEKALLILVGQADSECGIELTKEIKASSHRQRILITGWVEEDVYQQYLAAADVAVQLRSQTRGESSLSVLDCMAFALPTIINANGSMAELPQEAVYMLPDLFSQEELILALDSLGKDEVRRGQLGLVARQAIEAVYSPQQCARAYQQAIESAYGSANFEQLMQSVVYLPSFPNDELSLRVAAKALANSKPRLILQQLFVDISAIIYHDCKTGIQRVVRAQLLELVKNPPAGYRIEPVYFQSKNNNVEYYYARNFTAQMLGISPQGMIDAPIDIVCGDIFYGLDYYPLTVMQACKAGLFAKWRAQGIIIYFLIYDLLPVLYPQLFKNGMDKMHSDWLQAIAQVADGLIAISQTVVHDLLKWLEENNISPLKPLKLASILMGSDVEASIPTKGMPSEADILLAKLAANKSFLMVGTVESRKSQLQVLAAFEQLWREGYPVYLVIVGKEGWQQAATIKKLRRHEEWGRRLFWLKNVSDEFLEKIYRACKCLIAASEAEGFGLPLVEAARYGIPIIARDTMIFREVAKTHAHYFNGILASDLAAAIKDWLALADEDKAPSSIGMQWHTWSEATRSLIDVLIEGKYETVWPFSLGARNQELAIN